MRRGIALALFVFHRRVDMLEFQITPEALLAALGLIVSLVFSYFPGLRVRYAALSPEWKSTIMIAMLFLLTAAVFGLGCAGILLIGIACTQAGAVQIAIAFFLALATNQGTYQLTKNLRTADVKALSPPPTIQGGMK